MRLVGCGLIGISLGGCTCVGDTFAPICTWGDEVRVAFIGTVVQAGPTGPMTGRTPYWYRVRVDERLRGVGADVREVSVVTAAETSCSSSYTVGEQNLFVPARLTAPQSMRYPPGLPQDVPVIAGAMCSRHKRIDLAAEDVAFLRKPPGHPQLIGSVYAGAGNHSLWALIFPPLKGVAVKITGPDGAKTTKTDGAGKFNFKVTPGTYSVAAHMEGYPETKRLSVTVPPNGCGAAFIGLENEPATIIGRVISTDGTPASGLEVDALFSDPARTPRANLQTAVTDADGIFRLHPLMPGKLLVTVQRSVERRVHTTYFPGRQNRGTARTLLVTPSEVKRGIVVRLGRLAEVRRLSVKVVQSDGTPHPDALITAEYPYIKADANGVAEFETLVGVPYEVVAEARVLGTGRGSAKLGPNDTEATVVLK